MGYSLALSMGNGRRLPSKTCRGIGTLAYLTQKNAHAQGLLKPFIPFTHFYLEPPFCKQLHTGAAWLWDHELQVIEALRLSVGYGFHPKL